MLNSLMLTSCFVFFSLSADEQETLLSLSTKMSEYQKQLADQPEAIKVQLSTRHTQEIISIYLTLLRCFLVCGSFLSFKQPLHLCPLRYILTQMLLNAAWSSCTSASPPHLSPSLCNIRPKICSTNTERVPPS